MANPAAAELRARIAAAQPALLQERASDTPAHLRDDDLLAVPERVVDLLLYLRDTEDYVYLSNITVVDFLADGLLEVVYQLYRLQGGSALTVKTRVPRDNPLLPSLTPAWPGAELQEREAYDLYGVEFSGHPFLQRIYMWEEFEGFPMRKDFPKQGDKYIGAEE